jgi:TolB protein
VALDSKGLALSHDGRRIAYALGSWTMNRLWVANADGSGASALTDSTGGWFNTAWSPDDRRIAVTRRDSTRRLTIVVMNADGSQPHTVMQLPEADGSPQWPMWSRDGRRLAVQAGRYDREHPEKSASHIWVLDLTTGAATRLAPHADGRLDETPAWFPDGSRLAFQSDRTGAFEIWTMRSDGGDARRVTR